MLISFKVNRPVNILFIQAFSSYENIKENIYLENIMLVQTISSVISSEGKSGISTVKNVMQFVYCCEDARF